VAPATGAHDTFTLALPGTARTLAGADVGGGGCGTIVRVVATRGDAVATRGDAVATRGDAVARSGVAVAITSIARAAKRNRDRVTSHLN
jgi:hypothetical protein